MQQHDQLLVPARLDVRGRREPLPRGGALSLRPPREAAIAIVEQAIMPGEGVPLDAPSAGVDADIRPELLAAKRGEGDVHGLVVVLHTGRGAK